MISTICLAILGSIATPDGHACPKGRDVARPTVESAVGGSQPRPSCSLSNGLRLGRRHRPAPWTADGLDDFDTEVSDDSWSVDLDILASLPESRPAWMRPRASSGSSRPIARVPSLLGSYPLRC